VSHELAAFSLCTAPKQIVALSSNANATNEAYPGFIGDYTDDTDVWFTSEYNRFHYSWPGRPGTSFEVHLSGIQ